MTTTVDNKVYETPAIEASYIKLGFSVCVDSVGVTTETYNEFEDFTW